MADLLVIVPSRGRPESLPKVVKAWQETGAFADAALTFVIDTDDPRYEEYRAIPLPPPEERGPVRLVGADQWRPLVPKLNLAAGAWAGEHFALAFAGDDHLPRTPGWAKRYLDELRDLGTGIVYGNDRIQGERLPTQWAMTSDIVRTLGRMIPADVEHLYCDNAILDLGRAAECIRYLPDVVIEHCHPVAGRGVWDAGYERVNRREQYARDHAAYQQWRADRMADDVAAVKALRKGVTARG
ncbi:hypothetical protein AB0875_12555 [Micromonospora gifhornensis]|uniref:hypothetical protein n=1 Tax=Micromonospora gifhornensis TaxID=84594 RepID=UPI003453DC8E